MLNDSEDVIPTSKHQQVPGSPQVVNNMGSVNEIRISEIEVNPFQPRTEFDEQALLELSDSIKLQG